MGEYSDRLMVMLVAATGLLVFFLGWAGGLVEAEMAGLTETTVFAALALLFLAILVGIWFEFNDIDDEKT